MEAKNPSLAETLDAGGGAAPMHALSTDGDADTHLLQERLALMGVVGAMLSSLSFVIVLVSDLAIGVPRSMTSQLFHVAGIAIPLAAWGICRGAPRERRLVRIVDALTMVSLASCFAIMATHMPRFMRPDTNASLITLLVTTTRAILVPSSARRTLVLTSLAWLPTFFVPYFLFRDQGMRVDNGAIRPFLAQAEAEASLWAVLGITLVTVASRVIYGLRREVREAQKLGQYTLLEKLGEGGMGQVFRAQHAMLRRPTAVKLLHPDRGSGAEDLARFEREVQLTAQLSHPNVVTVFDYGRTPDGVFYYAMELLDGQNLEDIIEQTGPMTAARAVHVLAQVANALAEAHAVGLIHRDIKPANIILCTRGSTLDVAKVVDFGLVKDLAAVREAAAAPGEPPSDSAAADVSRAGTILGTPMYLAPEAMRDPTSVDGRADLYALGAVAYFLLTGTVVFGGRSVVDACRHHLHTPPEAPSARLKSTDPSGSIPADLEAIVLKCLEKRPADRHANARMLRDALVACSVAGTWSEADARAWAATRGARPAVSTGAPSVTSWSAKTIAVDLAR